MPLWLCCCSRRQDYLAYSASVNRKRCLCGQCQELGRFLLGIPACAHTRAAHTVAAVNVRQAFAQALGAILRERNMAAAELARLTGIAEPLLSRYLSGKRAPRLETVERIRDVLNVSPAALFDTKVGIDAVRSPNDDRLPQHLPIGEGAQVHHDPLLSALVLVWPWLAEDVRRSIAQQVIAHTPTTTTTTESAGPAALPSVG